MKGAFKMSKASVKEFFEKHKWELLAAVLLIAGTGMATYRIAYKRGISRCFMDMLAASYRDYQKLACYVDDMTEKWTHENRQKLAACGEEVLKVISEELSERSGAV